MVATAVIFAFLGFGDIYCNAAVYEFEPVQFYKTLPSASPILSTEAYSMIHCASMCISEPGCKAFDFDCQALLYDNDKGICNILEDLASDVSELQPSGQCFVQFSNGAPSLPLSLPPTVAPTITGTPLPTVTSITGATTTTEPATATTEPATATTEPATATSTTNTVAASTATTTTSESTVVVNGIVHNSIVYGSESYILFTADGLYIYETDEHLYTSGPLSGPHTVDAVLGVGMHEVLDPATIDCVIFSYPHDFIEIYSGGLVYIWQKYLYTNYEYGSGLDAHLGSGVHDALANETIQWCVYREHVGDERYFGLPAHRLFVASGLHTDVNVGLEEDIMYEGQNVNIFTHLSDDIVAVTNHHSDYEREFLLIYANLSVFEYHFDSASDIDIEYKGTLVV